MTLYKSLNIPAVQFSLLANEMVIVLWVTAVEIYMHLGGTKELASTFFFLFQC